MNSLSGETICVINGWNALNKASQQQAFLYDVLASLAACLHPHHLLSLKQNSEEHLMTFMFITYWCLFPKLLASHQIHSVQQNPDLFSIFFFFKYVWFFSWVPAPYGVIVNPLSNIPTSLSLNTGIIVLMSFLSFLQEEITKMHLKLCILKVSEWK